MSKELEEKVNNIEKTLSFYKGAFLVATIFLLGFIGVSSFILIPNAAIKAMENSSVTSLLDSMNKGVEKADKLSSIYRKLNVSSINNNNDCAVINQLQICWGKQNLWKKAIMTHHERTFMFKFKRPFDDPPIITNGINSKQQTNVDTFGIYNYELTEKFYQGAVMEVSRKNSDAYLTMSYIAIGKTASFNDTIQ